MKGYIISVLALVIISQISELILPSGKMKEITKIVFSLILILTLSSPLISIAKNGVNIDELLYSEQVNYDENYCQYVASVKANEYEEITSKLLQSKGYEEFEVNCIVEYYENQPLIKNIEINFDNSVIIQKGQHINKTEVAKEVAETLKIDEWRVTINEN